MYLHLLQLGRIPYTEGLRLQDEVVSARKTGAIGDTLLLMEHPPVLTLGRNATRANIIASDELLARKGVTIHETNRGGEVTYHGPGQLVAYGIIDLKAWELGLLDYVAGLEDTVISVLADWGLRGERVPKARGVWLGGRKIASLGLHVRHWVTMHGIALNIDPDMSHFDLINPCGMTDVEMTSLVSEMNKQVPFADVVESFIFHFGRTFSCTTVLKEPGVEGRAAGGR